MLLFALFSSSTARRTFDCCSNPKIRRPRLRLGKQFVRSNPASFTVDLMHRKSTSSADTKIARPPPPPSTSSPSRRRLFLYFSRLSFVSNSPRAHKLKLKQSCFEAKMSSLAAAIEQITSLNETWKFLRDISSLPLMTTFDLTRSRSSDTFSVDERCWHDDENEKEKHKT